MSATPVTTLPAPAVPGWLQDIQLIVTNLVPLIGTLATTLEGLTAVKPVPSTSSTPSGTSVNAGLSLAITSDVGEGFKFGTAVTNLITQRDKELNSPAEVQAANAKKIQEIKDHAADVISKAEATGDFTQLRLLLS